MTAAPRSTNLVSLADLRTYLGISGSSLDAILQLHLDATYADFSEYVGRPLARATFTERLPGDGGHYLLLSRWPVESIASITAGIDSPETVTASTYSIASGASQSSPRRDRVYRADGWSYTYDRLTRGVLDPAYSGTAPLHYTVTFTAGYLMPDQVTAWATGATFAQYAWTRSSDPTVMLRFECTTAGTTGGSEPTWPTTVGGTVTDGTVVWTAREATELPANLREAAKIVAASKYRGDDDVPANIKREKDAGGEIEYFPAEYGSGGDLPRVACRVLETYR